MPEVSLLGNRKSYCLGVLDKALEPRVLMPRRPLLSFAALGSLLIVGLGLMAVVIVGVRHPERVPPGVTKYWWVLVPTLSHVAYTILVVQGVELEHNRVLVFHRLWSTVRVPIERVRAVHRSLFLRGWLIRYDGGVVIVPSFLGSISPVLTVLESPDASRRGES